MANKLTNECNVLINNVNVHTDAMLNATTNDAKKAGEILYKIKTEQLYKPAFDKWSDFLCSERFHADRTTLSKLTNAYANVWSVKALNKMNRQVAETLSGVIAKATEDGRKALIDHLTSDGEIDRLNAMNKNGVRDERQTWANISGVELTTRTNEGNNGTNDIDLSTIKAHLKNILRACDLATAREIAEQAIADIDKINK